MFRATEVENSGRYITLVRLNVKTEAFPNASMGRVQAPCICLPARSPACQSLVRRACVLAKAGAFLTSLEEMNFSRDCKEGRRDGIVKKKKFCLEGQKMSSNLVNI